MTTTPVTPPAARGFDAGANEDLWFTFKPYVDHEGVIPEPSSDQIERLVELLRMVLPTKEVDGKTTLDLAKLQETFEGKQSDEVEAIVNEGIADVCSQFITADQIQALPYRVKQRFYGWLLGTLLSPEA
jgi:hypothetical protein